MRLAVLFCLVAVALGANVGNKQECQTCTKFVTDTLVNVVIRQLIELVRRFIVNGDEEKGFPPLDPLYLGENFHLSLPLGLINLDLDIRNGQMTGLGEFIVEKSRFDRTEVSLDLEILFPKIVVKADRYQLIGDLYGVIPIYGDGESYFELTDLVVTTKIYLKQSEDGKSILIDKAENVNYTAKSFISRTNGMIGGGEIDDVVNAIIGEVFTGYMLRFSGAIVHFTTPLVIDNINPILDQFDTWDIIAVILPGH